MSTPTRASQIYPSKPKAGGVPTPVAVLLIEDDPEFTAVLRTALEFDAGLDVRCTGTVADGLRSYSIRPPDVILLDLGLPDSEGLETLHAVQRGAPETPIVVLTGLDDEALGMEAVRSGAQDYLVKTETRLHSLVRALRYALERHALQAEIVRHTTELEHRNARVEEELKLAREIQQSYLPRQRVTFPRTARAQDAALRFSFHYSPAEIIGGDFFSVTELSETEVGLFICDVMGHGVSAALVSATVRGLIEEMKAEAVDPGLFLSGMNRAIHAILHSVETPIFVTAFYLVADILRGEVRFANAGHPTPFCVRPAKRQVRSLTTHRGDAALGLFEQTRYTVSKKSLRPGDLLLLFTDGLYEIESPFAEPYGRERLPNDIRKRIKMTPACLFTDLIEHIRDFSLSRRFDDDVCLVAMEVGRMGDGSRHHSVGFSHSRRPRTTQEKQYHDHACTC